MIRLKTPNLSRAAVLKMLLDNRAVIEDALLIQGLVSIEIAA